MPQDLSGFDAVLKIDYEKTIQEQINQKTPLLDMFQKQDAHELDATGKQVQYPVHVSRNSGAMSRGEDENLPTAGKQAYAELQVKPKYTYGRIQLTGQVIKQSLNSKGAFTRAMKAEMDGLINDLSNYRNRILWGYGKAVLCAANSNPDGSSATITVDRPLGVGVQATNGNRYVNVGDYIAFVQAASSDYAIRGTKSYLVSAVSADGTTITNSTGNFETAIADNDLIVKAYGAVASGLAVSDTDCGGSNGTDVGTRVPMGLLGLVDDTTYITTLQNISRSTYSQWLSYVLSSAGSLSLDMLQRCIDVVDIKGGGGVDYLATGHDTRRAYLALLEANRRYMGGDLRTPDGATVAAKLKDITYGTIPMKVCKHAPAGTLVGVDSSLMNRWVWSEGHWDDTDGNILHRVSNKDSFEAFYKLYDNFSTDRCNAHFRIDGITTTQIVVHND